jgi:agmatine deiminase
MCRFSNTLRESTMGQMVSPNEASLVGPSKEGFRMPAEWSAHSDCYVSWPCKELTWHGHISQSKAAYASVINTIKRFEPVTVLGTPGAIGEVRRTLGEGQRFIEVELDDSWIRDNGPIFVRNGDSRVALVRFGFNAWGGKYPPYEKDALVPKVLARHLGVRDFAAPMILEGGSITVDGEGTLITTEQCLLNKNRNPQLTRKEIETILADFLGATKVVWLGKGLEDDITDGHVDGVATFAGPHLVVAAHTKDDSDPNYHNLIENIETLETATDIRGRSFEVVRIVQPRPRKVEGIPITPGYTNHYIANGGVVVPTYGILEDKIAVETLRGLYPGREVAGVECSYIEIGGGAVHCITQQQPKGELART